MQRRNSFRMGPNQKRRSCCEALESRTLLSSVSLIKDINTGTESSNPIPLATVGSTLYFAASSTALGEELYKTDGTLAGTSLVVDARPGPGWSMYSGAEAGVNLNGKLLYSTWNSAGMDISISDGTAAGTSIVAQLNTSQIATDGIAQWSARNLTAVGGKGYFTAASTSGRTPAVLWVTDGTPAGTHTINQLTGNTTLNADATIAPLGTTLMFLAARQLWQTDGTAAGTRSVASGYSSMGSVMTSFDGKVWFFGTKGAQQGLWESDGTAMGTTFAYSCNWIQSQAPVVAGTKMYFLAASPTNLSVEALSVYDSSTHALTLVQDNLSPYPGASVPYIAAGLPNGTVLFQASMNPSQNGIWSSDGTSAHTALISNVFAQSGEPTKNASYKWGVLGNSAFLATSSSVSSIRDLTTTDGTAAGTHLLASQPFSASLSPQYFTTFLGKLLFSGFDRAHGSELWATDGTPAGTSQLFDLNSSPASAGSDPKDFSAAGGSTYFDATDTTSGTQPWVTDGTTSGTHMLAAVDSSGSANTSGWVTAAGKTFFINNFGPLYETDNTAAGTFPLSAAGISTLDPAHISYHNLLYLAATDSAHGTELFKTDGTSAGTSLVADVNPGSASSTPADMIGLNDRIVFDALDASGQRQVYCTDGTASNTVRLTSFASVNNTLSYTAILNNTLYFVVNVPSGPGMGMQLWQTDGTPAGTTMVQQLSNFQGKALIAATGSMLICIAVDPLLFNDSLLYRSDGTSAGTTLVKTFGSDGNISSIVTTNGKVFFEGYLPSSSYLQLWATDGTATGTKVLSPGSIYDPYQIVGVNGSVYFITSDYGESLWQSDGTVAGTVVDVQLSSTAGSVYRVFAVGGTLYLAANDGVHGTELMATQVQDLVSASADVTLVQDVDHTHIDWSTGVSSGQVAIDAANGLTINGDPNPRTIILMGTNGNALPNTLHLNGTFTINGVTGSNPLANTNLEIGRGTVFIPYASPASDPIATIRESLKTGYSNGHWTGTPTASTGVITSTAAAGSSNHSTAIGYADSADGLVPLPANTIELKYTLHGDTGLTGTVGFTDFMRMTQHYTLTGMTWGETGYLENSWCFELLAVNDPAAEHAR